MAKHAKVCEKVFASKRKPMDIAKMRNEGTDNAKFLQEQRWQDKKSTSRAKPKKATDYDSTPISAAGAKSWKAKSEEFRAAIRNAKVITQAQKEGIDIRTLKFEESQHVDDRIPCPHCGRKFAEETARRHIPKCKDIINKPKPVGSFGKPNPTRRR